MVWTDTPLCLIAQKYHTDKCRFHNYTPTYHRLLAGKQVKKVLEIGLGWGGLMHGDYPSAGSLLMWRDYFPDAEIYGLDIRPDTLRNEYRIHSFLCDQNNLDSLLNAAGQVGGNFDLIVDDGSHVPMHQVVTANMFVPLLAPGGLYVIEDVHDSFFKYGPEHQHAPSGDLTEIEYVRQNLCFPHEVIEIENDVVPGDKLVVIREEEVTQGKQRPSRCVVNVTSGGTLFYEHGQMRLARELRRFDPWTRQKFWKEIPAGWPRHRDRPYAFKSFAMMEAAQTSDLVLWCDSSIVPIRSMEPFWRTLERDGYFLVENKEGTNYEWTADSSYQYLFPDMPIDEARRVSRTIPQIVGGVLGVNVHSSEGKAFLDEYYRLANTDAFAGPWANENCPQRAQYGAASSYTTAKCGPADVKGHRHDQTAASVIAWRMGLKLSQYPSPYAYVGSSRKTAPTESTILLHDGPGVIEFEATLKREEPQPQKTGCPNCGSAATGMAGGMRHCNQCGYRW